MNIAIHGERELVERWSYEALPHIDDNHYIDKTCIHNGWVYVLDYTQLPPDDDYLITPSNYNEILNIIIERKDENS